MAHFKVLSRLFALLVLTALPACSLLIQPQTVASLAGAGTTGNTSGGGTTLSAFLYVGCDNLIRGYSYSSTDGQLTLLANSDVAAGASTRSIVIHPTGNFAYATHPFGTNTISVFARDSSTGELALSQTVNTGTTYVWIVVHPSGNFAYAITDSSTVAMFTVNPTNGNLTALTTVTHPAGTIAAGGNLRGVSLNEAGDRLIASSYNTNTLYQYSIDGTTGDLTSTGTIASVAGAISGVPLVGGNYFYVPSNSTAFISQYSVNGGGTLTAATPATTASGEISNFLLQDKLGRFLFSAGSGGGGGSGEIYRFVVANDGTLSAPTTYANSYAAVNKLALANDGITLFASHNSVSKLSAYTMDSITGALTEFSLNEANTCTHPSHLTFYP